MKYRLFFVGFILVVIGFFFITMLLIVNQRSSSAAPYFAEQVLFSMDSEGLTVFGQKIY